MYVLVKQENRGYTTDTIIFYIANNREILEEVLLSLFDALYQHEYAAADEEYDVLPWCIQRMKCYQIIEVPFIDY